MMREILNKRLYCALVDIFGEVGIQNTANAGSYTCPPTKGSMLKRLTKETKYAHVKEWGETYSVRCPECDDHTQRLYISYFTGKEVKIGSSRWQFGKVAVCHNERCHLGDVIDNILEQAKLYTEHEVEEVSQAAAQKYMNYVGAEVDLPKCFPLYSKGVPASVHEYIWSRGFDPAMLAREYEIRYMPKDTYMWTKDDETKVHSREDRILIPVVQGLFVTGWQARVVDDNYDGKMKYIFPPVKDTHGEGKKNWLYNKDKALFHIDMTICEGVTDVWKIGDSAVCTFGKTLSERQVHSMKLLWGYKGSCVICADHDAIDKWNENADMLRQLQIFPRGVAVIPFPEGYDPAMYDSEALQQLIADWRLTCHN